MCGWLEALGKLPEGVCPSFLLGDSLRGFWGNDGPLFLSSLPGGCLKTAYREGQARAEVPLSLESLLKPGNQRVIKWPFVERLSPEA